MSWQRRAKETAHASQEIYFTISMLPSTQCLLPSAVFHLSNSWTNCFSDSRTRGWIYFYFPINLTPHGHKSHSTSTGTIDDFVSSEDKTWCHPNQRVLIRNTSKACWHLKNEIQNQPVSNKYDLLARGWCLWRLCSVNASQSTCQLHSDYNTQLFLVPGPENLTTQFMNNILPSFRANVAVCPSCASIVWAPGRCCSSPRPAVSHQKHQHLQEISCQDI